MAVGRYRDVLREPYVGQLLLTAAVARLPQGMSGLAIILFLSPRLGYGRAGLATGVSVAAAGVSSVLLARAVDVVGARLVLVPAAAAYAAAMVGLAASRGAAYGIVVGICAMIGLVTPPVTSVSRGLWPRLLIAEQAQVVYGLEATGQELIFIAGPATVALVAGLSSARVAVLASGLLGLVGAVAYVASPPFGRLPRLARDGRTRLHLPGVLRYVAVGAGVTAGLGVAELAIIAFVGGRHASAASGILLAVWSGGSLLGGLRFGAAQGTVTDRTLARAVALSASGIALASLSPGIVGLAVILLLGGAAIAPTFARLYTRTGSTVGEGSTTEAFGWLAVGFLVGSSAGAAIGGVSVDTVGARWTFVLAGLVALTAVPVVARCRPVASSGGR